MKYKGWHSDLITYKIFTWRLQSVRINPFQHGQSLQEPGILNFWSFHLYPKEYIADSDLDCISSLSSPDSLQDDTLLWAQSPSRLRIQPC
ncbi:putative peptide methionine sulfoxide reductase [Fusarium oxysporum f. sp. albedinis]|nr:putative peptide methionine sulfoxide reductase [Fusarium oxysporum f. sp. albedinis]